MLPADPPTPWQILPAASSTPGTHIEPSFLEFHGIL
jgi:hypothetical protein